MIEKIQVYNRFHINNIVMGMVSVPFNKWYLISIYSSGDKPPFVKGSKEWDYLNSIGCKDAIALCFDDITPETKEEIIKNTIAGSKYRDLIVFNRRQAEEIGVFLEKVQKDDEGSVLVAHCDAGISRSGAVSYFASVKYGIPFKDEYIYPNKWVMSKLCEYFGMENIEYKVDIKDILNEGRT